ncbi:MAG: hypothetical protein ACYTFG_16485 [Planctomycetota bacterium]|jgi:hypothetical protein
MSESTHKRSPYAPPGVYTDARFDPSYPSQLTPLSLYHLHDSNLLETLEMAPEEIEGRLREIMREFERQQSPLRILGNDSWSPGWTM